MQLPPPPPSAQGVQPQGQGPTPAREPSIFLFSLFCFFGSALIAIEPMLGALVLAFASEVLFVHRRATLAYVACIFGAGTCLIWGLGMVLTVYVIAGCTIFAAQYMATKPSEGKFVFVGVVQACMLLALDMVFASQAGTTVWEVISQQVAALVEQTQSMPGATAADAQTLAGLVQAATNYWPVVYLVQGASLTLVSVIVSALARRRVDPSFSAAVKPFAKFDSSPHILWPLVIGLWCISTSYALPDYHIPLTCAGAMFLIVARILCGVQGAALVKSFLDRRGFSTAARVAAWIAFGLLDMVLMAVTLLGLVDIWANLRHLDRDDAPKDGMQERRG